MSVGFVVNPAISGRAASSRIPSRSAPSAKIFTVLSPSSVISVALRWPLLLLDPGCGVGQIGHGDIRLDRCRSAVVTVEMHGLLPGAARGFDVTPPVAHARAARQIEGQARRGTKQHARLGLAARAGIAVVMRAHADLVERHDAAQSFVHLVDLAAGLPAPRDVRLIGHHDEDEAGPPQVSAGFSDTWQHPELRERSGWPRHAVPDERLVEHSVPIEEAGWAPACRDQASNRPSRASTSMDSIDVRRACRPVRSFFQPSARMRSVLMRTTGTSPFQPRSPPVYSNRVLPAGRPTTSMASSAISVTATKSPVATLT